MNVQQLSKMNSYLVIQNLITKEKVSFSILSEFSERETAFNEAVSQIRALTPQQRYANKAELETQLEAKAKLVDQVALVAKKLLLYADSSANRALAADVNYTLYGLKRLKTNDLIDVAKVVLERGTKVLLNGAVTLLSQTDLSPITSSLDVVEDSRTAFRNQQIKTKQDTRMLTQAFASADEALGKLMLSVVLLIHSNRNLYDQFQDASKKVFSYRKLSLNGSVGEAKTEYPIVGVKITIRKIGEAAPADLMIETPDVAKVSSAKGGFQVRNLTEGNYLISASKAGYKTTNMQFTVSPSETTRIALLLDVA